MSQARAVCFDLLGTLIAPADDAFEASGARRELPDAFTCVSAIRAAGAKIAVVANVSAEDAAAFRRSSPSIAALVDTWHLSCETGAAKPSATIFHAAFAALEVEPAQILMVGDDLEEDVVPALALGMSAVWLRRDPEIPHDAAGVVTVDPHRASLPIPAERVPEGALVATRLIDVRRIALTWMWARRSVGGGLTAPLPPEQSSA